MWTINTEDPTKALLKRQAVERKIVRRFVKDALAAGYRLGVSLDRGYDVDDGMLLGSTDAKKIMDEAFAGDEAHIFIQPATGPTVEDGQVVSEGWVYIVLGNDGWDVISDYSTNDKGDSLTDKLLVNANALAEREESK
jgi:Fe-S cluster assembly iron-binding protein IscA